MNLQMAGSIFNPKMGVEETKYFEDSSDSEDYKEEDVIKDCTFSKLKKKIQKNTKFEKKKKF